MGDFTEIADFRKLAAGKYSCCQNPAAFPARKKSGQPAGCPLRY
jgi:hypothetical protein